MKGYKSLGVMPAQKGKSADRNSRMQTPVWSPTNSRQEKECLIKRFLLDKQNSSETESTL